jgi:hypothetical protein
MRLIVLVLGCGIDKTLRKTMIIITINPEYFHSETVSLKRTQSATNTSNDTFSVPTKSKRSSLTDKVCFCV